MKLSGHESHVFEAFTPEDMKRCTDGDQQWITERLPNFQIFPPHWLVSFKANECAAEPPKDALAVVFHGHPKPSECGGWVREIWTKGP